jgi:fructosamine-3-kinase
MHERGFETADMRRRDDETFVKRRPAAPAGFYPVEAAGLSWLEQATLEQGGVAVPRVIEVDEAHIVLPRLSELPATVPVATEFGLRLAAMHSAGARWFGAPPEGWQGDGFIGSLPMAHVHDPTLPAARHWGTFFAGHRVLPYARMAHEKGALSAADTHTVEKLCERLTAGEPDLTGPEEPPARIHGDLWSGNVLWTEYGAVLIDPAAHGGHRETDLAMLELFGLPWLDRVLDSYQECWPLADGWRERRLIHQLHPLLVHAVLFGPSYGARAGQVARRFVRG